MMFLLSEAPIFFEFLDMFFKKANSKVKIKKTKNLFLYDKCVCNKNNCNTFFLRTTKRKPDDTSVQHFMRTNKGYFAIELYGDGFISFVATGNPKLPYQDEHKLLFKHKYSIKKNLVRKRIKRKLIKKDKKSLHRFFWNLKIDNDFFYIDDYINEFL